jgi:hypothetical protein
MPQLAPIWSGPRPSFHGLDEADLGSLADGAVRRSFSKGQALFREGDDGGALYVMIEAVKVARGARPRTGLRSCTSGVGNESAELDEVFWQEAGQENRYSMRSSGQAEPRPAYYDASMSVLLFSYPVERGVRDVHDVRVRRAT